MAGSSLYIAPAKGLPLNSFRTAFAVLGLALAGLAFSAWWYFRTPSASQNFLLAEGSGLGCAEAALGVRTGTGPIVVVMYEKNDVRLDAFQKAMKRQPAVPWKTHLVKPDPKDPACPVPAFQEVLEQNTTASVLVFLVELPPWDAVQPILKRDSGPRLVALSHRPGLTRHRGYLEEGPLAILIGTRRNLNGLRDRQPQTAKEWFEHDYQLFTLQNINTLPE